MPPLGQLIFLKGSFRRTKCPVVAQTQGNHLVCIWGSLVKFEAGGVVVKTMYALCYNADLLSFCKWAYLSLSKARPGQARLLKLGENSKFRDFC